MTRTPTSSHTWECPDCGHEIGVCYFDDGSGVMVERGMGANGVPMPAKVTDDATATIEAAFDAAKIEHVEGHDAA